MKKLLCLVVALVMLFSLAACNNKTTPSPTPTVSANQPQVSDAATPSAEPADTYDPFGRYDQPVTITCVLGYDAPTDPDVPPDLTPETQSFVKVLKDKLNIDLQFMWSVPNAQYDQKFGVTLASGDLPDFMALDSRQFEMLKANGQLADLTEAYKYASPLFKSYVERDNGLTLSTTTTADGQIMAIPWWRDDRALAPLLWIRADWLKDVGMDVPKTTEELRAVAQAFVDQKQSLGIGMSKVVNSWGFDIRNYMFSFNAYPKMWIKAADGTLVPGEIQPETKTALAYLNSLYEQGLIDPEFAMKDESAVGDDVVSSKIGIVYGQWWFPEWPLNANKDADAAADWICTPIPTSENADPAKVGLDKIMIDKYYAVSSTCEHPEAIIKMFNLYCDMMLYYNQIPPSTQYGDADSAKGGFFWSWVPTVYTDPYEYETFFVNANAGKTDGFSAEQQNWYDEWTKYQQFEAGQVPWEDAMGHAIARIDPSGGWGLTRQITDITYNEFYGPATATQQSKGASLDTLTDETFLKIIMGEAPVDSFDDYVQQWKALGGDDVIKEVNDWYSAQPQS